MKIVIGLNFLAMRKNFQTLKLLSMACFFMSFGSFGQSPCAKVAVVIGEAATEEGELLRSGQSLSKNTTIITRESGWVKIILRDDSIIDLGSSSELKINGCQAENFNNRIDLEMNLGSLRALVSKTPKKKREGFEIKTSTSVLAVRGTEFFVTREQAENGEIFEQVGVKDGLVEVRPIFEDMMKPYLISAGSAYQAAGRFEQENGKLKLQSTASPKIDQFSAEEQKQLENRTKIESKVFEEAVELAPQSSNNKTQKTQNDKLAIFIEKTQTQTREIASNLQPPSTTNAAQINTINDPTSAGVQNKNAGNSNSNGPTPILIRTSWKWSASQ